MDEGKCSLCGAPASPSALYCAACGKSLVSQKQSTGSLDKVATTRGPSSKFERPVAPFLAQGVAVRFVAQLVDVTILGVVFWMLGFTGAGEVTIDATTAQVSISPFLGLLILIDVTIAFLYFTILEGRKGKTIGKMILNIKVVKQADYSSIGYIEAAVRTIMRVVDLIPFFVPYLLAAACVWSSESKQRLGDRVARTLVVHS